MERITVRTGELKKVTHFCRACDKEYELPSEKKYAKDGSWAWVAKCPIRSLHGSLIRLGDNPRLDPYFASNRRIRREAEFYAKDYNRDSLFRAKKD